MNGLEEILEDVLKQYQRVGYQTQVLRSKNTGEVLVSLRMGRVIANTKISMRDQIELRKLHDPQKQKDWLESMAKQLECKVTEYYASSVEIRHVPI